MSAPLARKSEWRGSGKALNCVRPLTTLCMLNEGCRRYCERTGDIAHCLSVWSLVESITLEDCQPTPIEYVAVETFFSQPIQSLPIGKQLLLNTSPNSMLHL